MIVCRHGVMLFCDDSLAHFGKKFNSIVYENDLLPLDIILGTCDRTDLGTHSNRKGAALFLVGLSICWSAVNIFLRAGWSVGTVQDQYVFADARGDWMVGLAAAGLDVNDKEFAILPPHFTRAGLARVRQIKMENLMEGFNHFPACFQRACPYLIARIIYQCNHPDSNQTLFEKLDQWHPLWNQILFASPATVDGKIYRNGYCALN